MSDFPAKLKIIKRPSINGLSTLAGYDILINGEDIGRAVTGIHLSIHTNQIASATITILCDIEIEGDFIFSKTEE